ncbi:hypothetical protein M409DRAFT_17178 [Zasmidium cellare ATCC 36951]|uniref:Uncharacterized protein n=1 Tax=Zasmidium cellare ATCC 36951 TaxID=1080233 RepID=A0A6A6D4V0_ZASCE|nr:uncharacterized protein M409DRAFT_17178 [Zasmidium cellare ATCC 36951]KAF2173232.1 hypothetical protein M409DRAFT_17178 [Zasmidium cellare ATCC 36951]
MASDKKDASFLRKQLPALRTTDAPMPNVSPSRSRTDPPAPEQQHHDKSHLHRRLHSNSIRHRAFTGSKDHHHRHKAKETVQSAIELKPPISFDTLLRRDKKSPDLSSRGGTNDRPHQPQQDNAANWAAQHAIQTPKRKVRPIDVKRVRDQNEQREEELRESLKTVEEAAMSSTRQLDDTYYSILEKASILRSTVASLSQLTDESRRLHASFTTDTSQLVSETKRNLNAFGNFAGQESTINTLVAHLKSSKDHTNALNARLEAARNRIEAYEKREKEKQKKRRKNWWIVWGVLLGFVMLVLGVWTAKHRSTVGTRIHHVAKVLDEFGNEIASPITAVLRPTSSPRENVALNRLFDEL